MTATLLFFFCLFFLTFQFLLSSLLYCCMCKCYLYHNHWISGIDSDTWKWVGSWKNSLVCKTFWVLRDNKERTQLNIQACLSWNSHQWPKKTKKNKKKHHHHHHHQNPPSPTCLQMKHIVLRSNLVMSFTWVLYKGELFLSFACGW